MTSMSFFLILIIVWVKGYFQYLFPERYVIIEFCFFIVTFFNVILSRFP